MEKYNYITQGQLNTALAEFFTTNNNGVFGDFFKIWAAQNIGPHVVLSPTQNTFVANVLTIFNNI